MSLDVLSARLTVCPANWSAVTNDFQVSDNVPDDLSVPVPKQNITYNSAELSLSNDEDVSPGKVIIFFSQVSATSIV
jgi:hypothetical protein